MTPSPNLTVALITRNEAKRVTPCLSSVDWAPDVVVVDAESTDATRQTAARLGARVFTRPFTDFSEQRNAALEHARGDWVLFLDADEIVPPECAREVQRIVERSWTEGDPVAYLIPFRNHVGDRWLRHGGLYPDYHLRLFRRELGSYRGRIHESVQIEGPRVRLESPIDHYPYRDLDHLLDKVERYARSEGWDRIRAGDAPWRLLLAVPARFFDTYLLHQGFRDGKMGLAYAAACARYAWVVYRTVQRHHERTKHAERGDRRARGAH